MPEHFRDELRTTGRYRDPASFFYTLQHKNRYDNLPLYPPIILDWIINGRGAYVSQVELTKHSATPRSSKSFVDIQTKQLCRSPVMRTGLS